MSEQEKWFPELMYEEAEDGLSSKIPFIMVPKEQEMPRVLFVFESRETGEFEPGPSGEKLPILEMDLHQYADMQPFDVFSFTIQMAFSFFQIQWQILCELKSCKNNFSVYT